MRIENSFVVDVPADKAWRILTDIPRVVPCMPGAELTEVVDEKTFRGTSKVKIGPVQLTFKGEGSIQEMNETERKASLRGRGIDTKGRGTAQAVVGFTLVPQGASTKVEIVTDLELSGAVAQYGRGVALIKEVANQLTQQFASNLSAQISQDEPSNSDAAVTQAGAPNLAREQKPAEAISGISLVFAALKSILSEQLGRIFRRRQTD